MNVRNVDRVLDDDSIIVHDSEGRSSTIESDVLVRNVPTPCVVIVGGKVVELPRVERVA